MDTELLKWGWDHSSDLLAILGAVVTVASLVTKLTPTPKDDEMLARLQKLLRRFSVPGFKDEAQAVYISRESLPLITKRPR